jgi:hypothetical protein
MNVVRKFLLAEIVWAGAILVLFVLITVLTGTSGSAVDYLGWLAQALGLAAFPAGITVSADVLAVSRPGRPLLAALGAASGVALFVFLLTAFAVPSAGGDVSLLHLLMETDARTDSWEMRNHEAWQVLGAFFAPVSALLYAAIGVQLGAWSVRSLSAPLSRVLYWVAGLGLIVSGYAVYDTTYETIVLHTPADVSFAAFYTLLIPAGICAGLALPTLALVRGAALRGSAD